MNNIKSLRKGDTVKASQVRTIAGTPKGATFTLECLGWVHGVPEFKRVDNGQLIPWVAISRGFVALV